MRLVFSPQRAPEFCPALSGFLNELYESRDGSAHDAPRSLRSSRKRRRVFLAGKGKLVFGSGLYLYDVFGLVATSLKEIPPVCLEGCGVGKDGNGKGERRDISQAFERVLKRSPRFPIPNILIEIQVRHSRDNEDGGRKRFENSRDAAHEFRQLKAGKSSGDSNETIYARWVNTVLSRETS